MKDKITLLTTPDKDDLKAAVAAMQRELPAFIENAKIIAKIRKASYDALIGEGFTPEQALELCANQQL